MTDSENISMLLGLMTAYQKSQVLFTFAELEISELLKENKKLSASEIARQLKIETLAMERFLNACVSLGLLKKTETKFSNTALTENFLVKDQRFFLGGQIARHRKRSSRVWSKLTEQLRKWNYGEDKKNEPESKDQGAKALEEQFNLALLHGSKLAENFDFSKYKKLLDLGGGTGAMSIGICQNYPELKSIVYDLPENIRVAEKFIKREKLENRISTIGGDFKEDKLPADFDAVLLANFMAVTDAKKNKKLLKKLYKKLPAGGAIIISGWLLDDSQLAPQISVLFCLEDICWNAPDVERSEEIYSKWLEKAGFSDVKSKTYLEPTKMLSGFKTGGKTN